MPKGRTSIDPGLLDGIALGHRTREGGDAHDCGTWAGTGNAVGHGPPGGYERLVGSGLVGSGAFQRGGQRMKIIAP